METVVRWGVVGLGRIAHKFAEDLALFEDAELVAVGSRSLENAHRFASQHGAREAFDCYEAVWTHPDVDIVYVATPHHQHAELSKAALAHGKHVLCEKPVAINAKEAAGIIGASQAADRFFMEALWSRFNPVLSEVIDRVRNGDIGTPRHVQADFSFVMPAAEGSRTHDLLQGGGSLLDVGIYPLFLAYVVLGMPETVQASMVRHVSGVDDQMAVVLGYERALATAYCGFASPSGMEATIGGEDGRILIPPVWHEADSYSLMENGKWDGQRISRSKTGYGLYHEIAACHEALHEGLRESPAWTHNDSLNLMTIMDRVRDAVGLIYPCET